MYTCELCLKNHDGQYGDNMKCKPKNGQSKYRFCSIKCARSFPTFHNREQINKKVSETFIRLGYTKDIKKIYTNTPTNIKVKKYPRSYIRYGNCPACGTIFTKSIKNSATHCSFKCFNELKKKETIRKANEFISLNGYHNCVGRLKIYLLEATGNTCSICKLNSTWNGKPLTMIMDHINGRSSDNRVDNVRLVCPNCDSQLDTYKSKNKNSDRVKRKGVW